MAIYYLDLDNGSDSNNGTTWALAWKTFTSGATAARIAAGDVIRVSKTPDPVSIGDATWTDGSKTVTLATAQTANVTLCESAWTASTNITCTTSANRKQGTVCASIAVATAFTTGKAAYFALGATYDFSAYQKISFWLQNSVALTNNHFKLCLCSDTAGATIVDEFIIPAIPSTGRYVPLTIFKTGGGNLGSSIQSVALHVNTDPGTPTLLIDNILAGTTNGLCHQCLISKNGNAQGGTEGYYGIQSIDGTTIMLDGDTNCYASATWNKYSGTTETVTTYMRQTYKTAMASAATTAVSSLNDSGTLGNNIEYQGGYEVGTTNQNGETFLDGLNGHGYGINVSSKSFNTINYLNTCRYNVGCYMTSSYSILVTLLSNLNNNTTYGIHLNSGGNYYFSTVSNACNNAIAGVDIAAFYNVFETLSNANNNGTYGIYFVNGSYNKILSLSNANNNNNYAVSFNTCSNNKVKILNTNGGTGIYSDANINYLNDSVISQTTEFVSSTSQTNNWVWSLNHDNTAGNHWGFTYQASVNMQTGVVHDTDPVAWKTAITGSTRTTAYPVKLKIGEIWFNASTLVTVKAWVKKDHATNVGARLITYANSSVGITEQSSTKASDTNWEELTITFTPTAAGVTEIYLESWYVAGNSNIYVAPITRTQA